MRASAFFLICLILIQLSMGSIASSIADGESGTVTFSSSISSTIIVAKDGTGDHTTIQDAVDTASDGDVIRVYDGIYYEAVNIYRGITLIGNGTLKTILDGNNTLDHQDLFHITANGVNVTGFQFREGSPHHEFAGVGFYSTGCHVHGNLFQNNNNNAVYFNSGPENVLANNTFLMNGYGVRSERGANGNIIRDNTFNTSAIGGIIYMNAMGVEVTRNEFNNNRYHLSLFNSQGYDIGWNEFSNADPGRSGLMISSSTDNVVHNNSFMGTDIGLGLSNGADRNLIADNLFIENNEGIRSYQTSTNVHVHRNSFINNTEWGMNCSSTSVAINATHNYWGNHTGPYEPSMNPTGTGDNVSINVTFSPWLLGEYVNHPPILNITGTTFTDEDSFFLISIDARDPDLDPIEFMMRTNASWLNLNSTSGNLTGLPNNLDVGLFFVHINISDGMGGFDDENISLRVNNTPPKIITQNLSSAIEDWYYEFMMAHDNEEGSIWEFSSNATWLEFDNIDMVLSGFPENDDVGSCWVCLNLSDGNGGYDEVNLSLAILGVDDPPRYVSPLMNFQFQEDNEYLLDLSNWVVDIDNELINYSYKGRGNLTVNFDPLEHRALIIPNSNWSGYEMGNFTAHFDEGTIFQTIMIDVLPVNDAPSGLSIEMPSEPVFTGDMFYLNGSADDPDIPYGDDNIFSWYSNISGFLGNGSSLYLDLPVGSHEILLNVTDLLGEKGTITGPLVIITHINDTDDGNVTPLVNDTDPDDNTTIPDDPGPDDNSTIPDNDIDPLDDDIEPVDDDAEGEEKDPNLFLYVLIALAAVSLISMVIIVVVKKGGSSEEDMDWDEEE